MATYEISIVRKTLNDNPVTVANSPKETLEYLLGNCFSAEEMWREKAVALFLDAGRNIIGHILVSIGGSTSTTFDKRIILKGALDTMASAVILCHNHPSGNPHPSQSDLQETADLKKACNIFDIKLLDHIILGESTWFSFSDEKVFRYPSGMSASAA